MLVLYTSYTIINSFILTLSITSFNYLLLLLLFFIISLSLWVGALLSAVRRHRPKSPRSACWQTGPVQNTRWWRLLRLDNDGLRVCGHSQIPYGRGSDAGRTKRCSNSMTRSSLPLNTFDWKKNCFLCGAECQLKKRASWSMVQSAIEKKSDKSDMYSVVLEAAERRKDTEMLTRLHGVPNGDLVAIETRYHRSKSCYLKYIKLQKLDVKQPEGSEKQVPTSKQNQTSLGVE